MGSMRSAILVDAVLNFEIKGEHIHITDEGGAVHLALPRSAFFSNLRRYQAVAAMLNAPTTANVIAWEAKRS